MKIYFLMVVAGLFFSASSSMPWHDYKNQCLNLFVCRSQPSNLYIDCLGKRVNNNHPHFTLQQKGAKVLDYLRRDAWAAGCPWNSGY
jgi:hypothetical protein